MEQVKALFNWQLNKNLYIYLAIFLYRFSVIGNTMVSKTIIEGSIPSTYANVSLVKW